jgi:metallo-beta-lactamase class B
MIRLKNARSIAALLISLSWFNLCSTAQTVQLKVQPDWIRDFEPFRIAGNLYYVGTYELGSYLITTSQGNILINTGTKESVPMIRSHVERLGFNFADIRILLTNQAHFDHVGGMAEVKKITHAQMMVDEYDAPELADGGNSDYVMGGKGELFEPVKADRLLHDHDTIRLGDMQIVMLHHPGHTKGSCSFLFDVKDDHGSYRVLIANMPTILDETKLSGMPNYPNVGKDYAYTLNELGKLRFDLWLCPHAEQFNLHQKHRPGDTYQPAVFIDQKGYDSTINLLQAAYLKRLK